VPAGILSRFDAAIVVFPEPELGREEACEPHLPPGGASFEVAAFDDDAVLWVRRDGVYAALAAPPRRHPCAPLSAEERADPGFTRAWLEQAQRNFERARPCASCQAELAVARLAAGEEGPAPSLPNHPVSKHLRAALETLAGLRALAADARAAAGDLAGANAGYFSSLAVADTARARRGLARGLAAVGEYAAAAEQARHALAFDPGDAEARLALAAALRGTGAIR
jgi:hypothetical protein